MTSKERMMLAIHREKPDRLPVTIHQWQPYHLENYMGGMSDLEANKAVGLDASINYYRAQEPKHADWQVQTQRTELKEGFTTRYTITTPEGTLTTMEGTNPMTTWVVEHLIKNKDDIHLLAKYRPLPILDKEGALSAHELLGDDGILRTFLCGKQGGCWQDACELYGVENLIMATFDDPDWVHEFLGILLKEKLHYIEDNLKGLPFDLVETGGGASSNTVISPGIHREFCLPYDRKIHDALHAIGHKVVYHTCGGMTRILDQIVENGCDASETLSPAELGGDIRTQKDILQVKAALQPHVCMIGGMDQVNILSKDREAITSEVRRLFDLYGTEGGYICSTSDHFFDTPRQSLEHFAQAARECLY